MHNLTLPESQALRDACDILETEANNLAKYLEFTLKTKLTLRTQEIVSIDQFTPPRVVIAIHSEMARLRRIAQTLIKIPEPMFDPDPED